MFYEHTPIPFFFFFFLSFKEHTFFLTNTHPTRETKTPSHNANTHQSGLVRRLDSLHLDLVPVDVLEERVDLDLAVGAEGNAQAPRGVLVQQLKGEGQAMRLRE